MADVTKDNVDAEELTRERQLELIEKARGGDREAFNALVAVYNRPLCGYCAAHSWVGMNRAEDIAQDIWLQAWLDIGKDPNQGGFDPERGTTFYTYILNRYARYFVRRNKPPTPPPPPSEIDEDIREPSEQETQSWANKCLVAKEELRLRACAFEAALRIVMHCGGYPHQQVAFCVSKALYGKPSPRGVEGAPARVDREYGAMPLSEALHAFLQEYAKDAGTDPGRLEPYAVPIRTRLDMTVGDLMRMDHVSARRFSFMSEKRVGETCLRNYYGQKSFTTAIPDWCYKVQQRTHSLVVFDKHGNLNGPDAGEERSAMCVRCKLRHTPPCRQEP